jgi:hypothetical protein
MDMTVFLALHDEDVVVLLDALNEFAQSNEDAGDPCGYAKSADALADRVGRLVPLVTVQVDQVMRGLGIGRYRDRPQG